MGTLAIAIILLFAFMAVIAGVKDDKIKKGQSVAAVDRIGQQCGIAFLVLSIILCLVVIF